MGASIKLRDGEAVRTTLDITPRGPVATDQVLERFGNNHETRGLAALDDVLEATKAAKA